LAAENSLKKVINQYKLLALKWISRIAQFKVKATNESYLCLSYSGPVPEPPARISSGSASSKAETPCFKDEALSDGWS
jgi:hypothetical protein